MRKRILLPLIAVNALIAMVGALPLFRRHLDFGLMNDRAALGRPPSAAGTDVPAVTA